MAASALTTSFPLPNVDGQTLVASVVAANPTATTYVLNCPDGTDSSDCGTYDMSITLGPWASPSPTGKAAGGDFDVHMAIDTFTYSVHCPMSHTAVAPGGTCTVVNIGGNNDGTETMTITSGGAEFTAAGLNDFSSVPVTITAGLDNLAASASATATNGGGGVSATATATNGSGASATASRGATATSGSGGASATASSGATATATTSGTATSAGASGSASASSTGSGNTSAAAGPRMPKGLLGLFATALALTMASML